MCLDGGEGAASPHSRSFHCPRLIVGASTKQRATNECDLNASRTPGVPVQSCDSPMTKTKSHLATRSDQSRLCLPFVPALCTTPRSPFVLRSVRCTTEVLVSVYLYTHVYTYIHGSAYIYTCAIERVATVLRVSRGFLQRTHQCRKQAFLFLALGLVGLYPLVHLLAVLPLQLR